MFGDVRNEASRVAERSNDNSNANYSAAAADDATLIERARKSRQGGKFSQLYDRGDWRGAGYASQSEADLSLCRMLAFWFKGNRNAIDRMFKSSALYRDKWDREDYRDRTIDEALNEQTEFYNREHRERDCDGEQEETQSPTTEAATAGARPEPAPASKYSDIALSNGFAEQRGEDLLHAPDGWRVFDQTNGTWVRDEKLKTFTAAKRFLTEISHQVYEDVSEATLVEKKTAQGAKKTARRAASAIASAGKVAAIVSLTQSHPAVAVTLDRFDGDNWALNTPAGMVNLRDGTIRPTRRNDYVTKCTPVAPVDMPTPVWDQFLLDIMGARILPDRCKCATCEASEGRYSDEERALLHLREATALVAYLTRLYGYSLSGDVSEHVVVIQIGDGANGKSLTNDVVSVDCMGLAPAGYACSLPVEALLASRNERHPTELMSLFHSRLALARESDEGGRWNESRVKILSGSDPITARLMRQDFVTFLPTHKLISFSNVRPILRGSDQAAWRRRLHFIPFPQAYADVPDPSRNLLQADKTLRDKLRKEAPGILYKLIQGCIEYQSLGLQPPETIRQSSEAYLKQQNVVARWLDERCDVDVAGAETKAEELWSDFKTWGEAGKEYVGHRKDFNEKLERLGIKITRTRTARGGCLGVKLHPSDRDVA